MCEEITSIDAIQVEVTYTAYCPICKKGFSTSSQSRSIIQARACQNQGISTTHTFGVGDEFMAYWGERDEDGRIERRVRVIEKSFAEETHVPFYSLERNDGREVIVNAEDLYKIAPGAISVESLSFSLPSETEPEALA